jgi:hypothetical protein
VVVAVNVTAEPEQIEVVLALILAVGVTEGATFTVNTFDVLLCKLLMQVTANLKSVLALMPELA